MALESRAAYIGDGVMDTFAVSFPYIHRGHVKIKVNVVELFPTDYEWITASSVRLKETPAQDDVILIYRETPIDDLLVKYQNGAVLTADELNLATQQTFYLAQELRDGFKATLDDALVTLAANNGLVVTNPGDVIQQLVQHVLSQELADELQQRITDIDTNGQNILDAIDRMNLLGGPNAGRDAFILDTDTVHIDTADGETFAQRLSALGAFDDANAAAIAAEQIARADADGALASELTVLTSRVGDNEAIITQQAQAIDGLNARYGVSLNVNGYVTGFEQFNDGSTGTFAILADRFYVVDPKNGGQDPTAVFAIEDGVVVMRNCVIGNALISDLKVDKLTAGDLNANMNIGTGRITWDNGVFMKVCGVGFGSENQFLEWFGPKLPNLDDCHEGNARYFLKVDGDAYFQGSLHVGTLTNTATSSGLGLDAYVEVGPFGTNGNPIVVNASYSRILEMVLEGDQRGEVSGRPRATLGLRRNGVDVRGFEVLGGYTERYNVELDQTTFRATCSGSITYTDSEGGTYPRTFRLDLGTLNIDTPSGIVIKNTINTQRLTLVTQED